MSGARTCPECGKRVSAFAAGCENCGADLEAYARRERLAAAASDETSARRRLPRPRWPEWLGLTRLEAVFLAVTLFFVAFVPVLGTLLAALGVMHGSYERRWGWLALCAALAVAGLVLAFAGPSDPAFG